MSSIKISRQFRYAVVIFLLTMAGLVLSASIESFGEPMMPKASRMPAYWAEGGR